MISLAPTFVRSSSARAAGVFNGSDSADGLIRPARSLAHTPVKRECRRRLGRNRNYPRWPPTGNLFALVLTGALFGSVTTAVAEERTIVYQGQLKQGGVPITGTADLQFYLYYTADSGDVMDNVTVLGVAVLNGLFTVPVTFSELLITGQLWWLEVRVRYPAGSGGYTALNPRQQLVPTPYAWALPGLRTEDGNIIGGASSWVAATVVGATISGGGNNNITDNYGTIGGGSGNAAGDQISPTTNADHATVGGGNSNDATAENSTVAGAKDNQASGPAGTVGGGENNIASGTASTVPGGYFNAANGDYSYAAGTGATVRGEDYGTFVWADTVGGSFTSTGMGQFLIRAAGGVGIGTNAPANALSVAGDADFAGRVGIGTPNPGYVITNAKLDVLGGHIALSNGYGVFSANSAGDGPGAGFDAQVDDSLDLVAGGAVRAHLTTDGKLGIGTTAPSFQLQSTQTQSGALTYPLQVSNKGDAAETSVGMLFQVDVGSSRGKGAIAYERAGTWNRGHFHILQSTSDGPDVATLDDAVVTIKNNGRIGIGTRTPTTHLDITVDGISHAGVNIKNTNSDQRYLIQVNGTSPGSAERVGNLEIWGTGSGGNHNVFTATSTGNVGIRNQTPEHPLQVGTTFLDGNRAHLTAGGVWTNESDRNSKCSF